MKATLQPLKPFKDPFNIRKRKASLGTPKSLTKKPLITLPGTRKRKTL